MNIIFINQFFTKVTVKVFHSYFCPQTIRLIGINHIGFAAVCIGIKLINFGTLLKIILVSVDKQKIAVLDSGGKLIYNQYSIIATVNQLHIRCGVDRTCANRSIAKRIADGFNIHPIFSVFRGLDDDCPLHNVRG